MSQIFRDNRHLKGTLHLSDNAVQPNVMQWTKPMNEPKSQMEAFPFLPALVLFGTFCLVVAVLLSMQPRSPVTTVAVAPTEAPTETPTPEIVEVADASYDPAQIQDGQILFSTTCSACHGMNARGVPGLGKDLIASEFVHGLSDEELVQFIITGRPSWDEANTTGIDMPARGGNPSLNPDQIQHIVAYLRAETDNVGGGVVVSQPTAVPAVVQNPTTAATSQPISVPSEDTVVNLPPVEPRSGDSAYAMLCAGCHGANGEGTANNGPAITDSELLTDNAALVEFLTHVERIVPEQGFVHAPRGGYPPLTDDEVEALTQYLQELTEGN
jgi:disulfide bond formation protein DsbB